MAVLGPWAAMATQAVLLRKGIDDSQVLSGNLVDIGGFLVLLAWGITLRKNPAAHKRMMLLATISLAPPGFVRLAAFFLPMPTSLLSGFFFADYGSVLLIALMAGWDWWRGRLVRSFAIGAAALLAADFAAVVLYFWGPWKVLTRGWVEAWVRLHL